jgi:hypothetical protein
MHRPPPQRTMPPMRVHPPRPAPCKRSCARARLTRVCTHWHLRAAVHSPVQRPAVTRHSRTARHNRDLGYHKPAGRDITHEKHWTVVPVSEWRPQVCNPFGQPADLHAGLAHIPRRRAHLGGRA